MIPPRQTALPPTLPLTLPLWRRGAPGTRILLLGGTGDGLAIARHLSPRDLYSVAGLGKTPEGLQCEVRVGGYGGVPGLTRFLQETGIGLIIDATHPFAAQMSRHAALAGRACGVRCWALWREPWQAQAGDDWRSVHDWREIVDAIAPFARPLFTLGREPLAHLDAIPASQCWAVRCLPSTTAAATPPPDAADAASAASAGSAASAADSASRRFTMIAARGPFTLDAERALFDRHGTDVLVTKHSGGAATEAKLTVARERGLPVVMLERPTLPAVDRVFGSAAALVAALTETCDTPHLTSQKE